MAQADRDATRKAFSKPAAFDVLIEGLTLKTELSAPRLRELLHYDTETGVFTRRIPAGGRNGRKFPAGVVVGSRGSLGYLEVGIDGRSYLLHRLAFLFMIGEWPVRHVDHINGCRDDNRWENLREVDNTTNIENRQRANKNSRSGLLGAHWNSRSGQWDAGIMVARKSRLIGSFDTPEAAHAAYLAEKRKVHKGCTL